MSKIEFKSQTWDESKVFAVVLGNVASVALWTPVTSSEQKQCTLHLPARVCNASQHCPKREALAI